MTLAPNGSGTVIGAPSLPKPDLFNRAITLQVGTVQVAARSITEPDKTKPLLKIVFRIEKSTEKSPNTTTVSIYNLSEATRKRLQKGQPVIIQAGYTKILQQIFFGTVSYINQVRESADWITTLHCSDGGDQYGSARMSKAYSAGMPVKTMLMDAAATMGVGLGNLLIETAGPNARGFMQFLKGAVVSGKVSDILDRYLGSCGMDWSIQDGQIQVLPLGQASREPAIVLSSSSGLIGSPELGENGVVKAKSLLQGGLKAGRFVQLISRGITGMFVTEKVVHSGDTWGPDWCSEIEAHPYSAGGA